ncbi:zinc finger protein OZF-like [Aricia agestis]|uniref:zinc finger protein OZF-like n=1 Tax=Aricia agestis TaxID=91739 RepID=UPI001C20755C|nr:zinc finger protein OZF-like [Aricia agestis]
MSNKAKLCRTCLTSIESVQYCLFDNVSPDMYWFCTSIQVKPEDTISKAVCKTCFEKLTTFYEFKNACIQSYKTLVGYEENVNNLLTNDTNPKKALSNTVKEESFGDSVYNDVKPHFNDSEDSEDNSNSVFAEPLEENENITHKRVKIKEDKTEALTCNICNRHFLNQKRLSAHKLVHKNKKVQKTLHCVPCNKKFLTRCGLQRHNANWHQRSRLSAAACGACGKVVRSVDTLRAHVKLHAHRQPHICSICGKAYSSSFGLKIHLEIHQENRERQCTCEYCGKKFFTKKTLSGHVSRCHTGKRYICQICNFPFTDKHNLAKHIQLHEGKRLYKCKVCEKSFTTNFGFEEHQRIHSGERPFSCTYCPKSFLSKKRLNEHNRIHTGEKPYKCSVCARGFTQKGTMKRHMKIHDKIPVI